MGVISHRNTKKAFQAVVEDNADVRELYTDMANRMGLDRLQEIFFIRGLHI